MYGHLKDRRMRTRIASVVVLAMLLGLLAPGAAMAELDEAVEEPAAEAPSANEAPAEEAAEPEAATEEAAEPEAATEEAAEPEAATEEAAEPEAATEEAAEPDEDAGAEALTISPMQTNETPPTPMVEPTIEPHEGPPAPGCIRSEEDPGPGTHTVNGITFTIVEINGEQYLSWESDVPICRVIVKGGPNAHVYEYPG